MIAEESYLGSPETYSWFACAHIHLAQPFWVVYIRSIYTIFWCGSCCAWALLLRRLGHLWTFCWNRWKSCLASFTSWLMVGIYQHFPAAFFSQSDTFQPLSRMHGGFQPIIRKGLRRAGRARRYLGSSQSPSNPLEEHWGAGCQQARAQLRRRSPRWQCLQVNRQCALQLWGPASRFHHHERAYGQSPRAACFGVATAGGLQVGRQRKSRTENAPGPSLVHTLLVWSGESPVV